MSTNLNTLAHESGTAGTSLQAQFSESNQTLFTGTSPGALGHSRWSGFAQHIMALVLATTALIGCGSLPTDARYAIAADAGTTAAGLLTGVASEANPLLGSPVAMVGMIAARFGMVEYANGLPEPQRSETLGAMNSIWWGAAASNLAILVAGSNPAGLVIGAAAALWKWNDGRDERTFISICLNERATNPALVCKFNGVEVAASKAPAEEPVRTSVALAN